MNIQPGMIVWLKNRRGPNWNSRGDMDRYKGRQVKISKVSDGLFNIHQDGEDNDYIWSFSSEDVESISNEEYNLLIFN